MSETQAISWSRMSKFYQCQRKYGIAYIEGLERKPTVENRARMLGSAFHEGMAAFLKSDYSLLDAIDASRAYLDNAITEWTSDSYVDDTDYYRMVGELAPIVMKMLEFYLPRLEIGVKWGVACEVDLDLNVHKPGSDPSMPLVEYSFEIDYGGYTFKGIVDAVLIDADDNLVLVDWKTRAAFPQDALVFIDGQLPFYAALLNHAGANIQTTAMWQFITSTPKPAVMLKSGLPSRDKKKLGATIWDVWSGTLPVPHKPERYEEEFRPLMGSIDRFIYPAFNEVTERSSAIALRNAVSTAKAMDAANKMYAEDMPLPAVLSSAGCNFCDFIPLCEAPLKYGFPPEEIVEAKYRSKQSGHTESK